VRIGVSAPAKINLWLRIGPVRPSGYHDLDTLFCALELADSVTLRPGESGTGLRLQVAHAAPLAAPPDLGPASANLAVRAAAAFIEAAGIEPDFQIDLVKRIPAGAGLGGGSSDAAAVLRALEQLRPGVVASAETMRIAGGLGSDVPFFLAGRTLAHGRGRGTRLVAAAPLPARTVLIVLPPFGIATARAYAWLDDDRAQGLLGASDLGGNPTHAGSWDDVARRAVNDFEPVIFRRYPELERARDLLTRNRAAPALLAGSGSTLFGVFTDTEDARRAAAEIEAAGAGMRMVLTRTAPA
jgi:4-diphosphocytidyl-2-C-methyl-D-erythritol kinase